MQLPEGAQWVRVSGTAAGTTVIKASRTALYTVVIGQSKTGTVTFYDHPTGATNLIMAVDNTIAAGAVPNSLEVGARLRNGLTVVTGGTTDMVVTYQ